MPAISFHLLDIPAELAFIYSKLDSWSEIHNDKNILKLNASESAKKVSRTHPDPNQQLPLDINSFSFNKFIQIYIKVWLKNKKLSFIKMFY